MTRIIEFSVPANAFPLGDIFLAFPDVEVELERMIPTSHAIVPYFWVWVSDVEEIPAQFKGHPAVKTISLIDTVPSGGLFRGDWQFEIKSILRGIIEMEVTLLSGTGTQTEWAL